MKNIAELHARYSTTLPQLSKESVAPGLYYDSHEAGISSIITMIDDKGKKTTINIASTDGNDTVGYAVNVFDGITVEVTEVRVAKNYCLTLDEIILTTLELRGDDVFKQCLIDHGVSDNLKNTTSFVSPACGEKLWPMLKTTPGEKFLADNNIQIVPPVDDIKQTSIRFDGAPGLLRDSEVRIDVYNEGHIHRFKMVGMDVIILTKEPVYFYALFIQYVSIINIWREGLTRLDEDMKNATYLNVYLPIIMKQLERIHRNSYELRAHLDSCHTPSEESVIH